MATASDSDDHPHVCRYCRPDLWPGVPRQNEGHVSVRFGDWRITFAVALDGVDVSGDTQEAQAGADGWVIRVRRPAHLCGCGRAVCVERTHGNVTITRPGRLCS